MDKKADILFEVSWEVCNKVGGIYTVVKSKAAKIVETYGNNNYFLIGPYFASKAIGDFQEEMPNDSCKATFEELKKIGIICHFGKWLIEGFPYVILIDFVNFRSRTNDIKTRLWEWNKVDSLKAGNDYDEPVAWAYAAGMLIDSLSHSYKGKKIVAQFHEWLAGAGLLYLKENNPKIGTVFTTHATILGRTLSSSDIDLYNVWEKIKPDEEAYKYGIEAKHLLEKASANSANVFTTVSEITGMEASHLLGRKPDVLLLNGLDISKFPTFEELMIKHRLQRDRIREFMLYYFFPYYTFDPKQTLIYFIAGRYEFRDKGIDVYIKALGQLNEKMKKSNSKKTIISFIWVPANFRNVKTELLENKTFYQDIKDGFEEVKDDVEKDIVYSFVSGNKISKEMLFDDEFLNEIKIRVARFVKKGTPPLCTHDLYDPNDTILNALKEAGLNNKQEDKVKIVYYPIYLSGADGLLNLNYYEAMEGAHLGIFPSYYEPWGYTPLEASALGVSSITTDLAGFGRYICTDCVQGDESGIFVLKRLNTKEEDIVGKLAQTMHKFAELPREQRVANKQEARKLASTCDWKNFIKNYIDAHDLACGKTHHK